MKYIVIDGKSIKSEEDFHNHFAAQMNFPDYYGKNLGAFWDCITDCIGYEDWRSQEVTIKWNDHQISKKHLGEKFFDIVIHQFEDIRSKWKSDLKVILN